MCGITAVFGGNHPGFASEMASILLHRGPDGVRSSEFDVCSFGHSRLSIVDLAGSDQPISSESGTHLVQNGEIYNYIDIRSSITGFPWRTKGDAETILALHQAYIDTEPKPITRSHLRPDGVRLSGDPIVEGNPATRHIEWVRRLDGIWGFALFDEKRMEMILCRDPLGVKPLVRTSTQGGELLVASEVKALRGHPNYSPSLDENAMLARLAFEYPLDDTTLFAGVTQVAPGTIETWQLDENGNASLTGVASYTSEDFRSQEKWDPSLHAQDLLDSLCTSISDRLMSDVPLGIILSGGLDSSLVAGLAHRAADLAGQPVPECWTIAEDEDNPDFVAALEVASALDLGHHTSTLEEDSFWKTLPALGWHGEDLDVSVMFFQPLFENMSKHVTVGLCGQGADELHGGYPRYRDLAGHCNLIQARLRHSRHRFADSLISGISKEDGRGRGGAWRRNNHDPTEIYQDLDSTLKYEVEHGQLTNFQLRLVDRNSMAHGLEVRVPFLGASHRAASWKIPADWKVRGAQEKLALRAAADLTNLPKSIVHRPKMPAGTATSPTLLSQVIEELTPHAKEWVERYPRLKRVLSSQHDMVIGLRLFESLHLVDDGLGRQDMDLMTLLEDID